MTNDEPGTISPLVLVEFAPIPTTPLDDEASCKSVPHLDRFSIVHSHTWAALGSYSTGCSTARQAGSYRQLQAGGVNRTVQFAQCHHFHYHNHNHIRIRIRHVTLRHVNMIYDPLVLLSLKEELKWKISERGWMGRWVDCWPQGGKILLVKQLQGRGSYFGSLRRGYLHLHLHLHQKGWSDRWFLSHYLPTYPSSPLKHARK